MSVDMRFKMFDKHNNEVVALLGEEWVNYPKCNPTASYQASTGGRLRRHKGNHYLMVNTKISMSGVTTVSISIDGKQTTRCLKNIIAEVFVPNPENLPNVRCLDGNNYNFRSDNLYWYNYRAMVMGEADSRKKVKAMLKKFDGPKLEELIDIMSTMI